MIPRRILSLLLAHAPLLASAEIVLRGDGLLLDHRLEINQQNGSVPEESQPDPAGDDLVLFNNGDLMHGVFGGIDKDLFWKRQNNKRPIKFGIPSIKQIIFKSTRRLQLDREISFITLTGGDKHCCGQYARHVNLLFHLKPTNMAVSFLKFSLYLITRLF